MNKTMMFVFGCLGIGMALLATTAHGVKTMKVARTDLDKTVKDSASFQDRMVGGNPKVAWHPGSVAYNVWVDAKAPKTVETFEFDKPGKLAFPTAPGLEDTRELGKRRDFELDKPNLTITPDADFEVRGTIDTFEKGALEAPDGREFNSVGSADDVPTRILG